MPEKMWGFYGRTAEIAEQRGWLETAPRPASFGRIECLDIPDLATRIGGACLVRSIKADLFRPG